MTEQPTTIMIVEDDEKLSALLEEYLVTHGFEVSVELRGDRAIDRIIAESPDIVVLDLMLPGANGQEVCQRVRQRYDGGILMLTASKADVDQVLLLEVGADDYVHKPIEPRVLLARIRSLLRRVHSNVGAPPTEPESVDVGRLSISRLTREAIVEAGEPLPLTSVEFDVLWLLAKRAGEVVTRDELYEDVRGIRYDGIDRGMDVHVSRLRRKMGAAGLPKGFIKSVRSAGYLLSKPT